MTTYSHSRISTYENYPYQYEKTSNIEGLLENKKVVEKIVRVIPTYDEKRRLGSSCFDLCVGL
ncbi:hypothetical protein J4233_01025 [Candidatus Pacearchaeota archaeon]|nr:hypothetical protein [uncultured archaeon]AQS28857.1 hypothetical protein [uncultured archaeon]AQS29044.1 hypothetical protein [uncultured archaeon]MBS3076832.1 hypothetical protein [Candidatus Pacearchaeota archaeon]